MRLTPSWFRSSSDDSSEERSEDSAASSAVTIYHSPPGDLSAANGKTERAAVFIPESDTALLGVLDDMKTPTTVDEVADQLIRPARPPIETWATVHETLHQDRLPELETAGYIEFDTKQGTVEYQTAAANTESRHSSSPTQKSLLKILLALVALIAVSVLLAVVVVSITTTVPVLSVPGYL